VSGSRLVLPPVPRVVADLDPAALGGKASRFVGPCEDALAAQHGAHPGHRQPSLVRMESMACTGAASPAIRSLRAPSTIRCRSRVFLPAKAGEVTARVK